jgi:type II secretory pathway component PulC
MKKDFSPEERLLRLIKGVKKKEEPKKENAPEIRMPEAVPQIARPPVPREGTSKEAKAISIAMPFKLKGFNPRALNAALIAVLIAILAYFIYDLFYTSYRGAEMDILKEADRAGIPNLITEDALEVKPYSYYSSPIKGRDIFMPQQVEVEPVAAGPALEEISAGLSLIGIIAGERSQAIIEDKKAGKSHFLYKGGSIGKVKVIDILEDSVIMEYQGETFELVL